MISRKHLEPDARQASGKSAAAARAADGLAHPDRDSWKKTFGKVFSPAFRLHRYRTAHNRLLQNALCKLDAPAFRDCRIDE